MERSHLQPVLQDYSQAVSAAEAEGGQAQQKGDAGDCDVRRDRAVATEETMPPEQPQIARLRHRMLGHRRRVVGIRQSLGPVGVRPIDRSAGLIAPSRVVINAVGRVGDHKVRLDAAEHALGKLSLGRRLAGVIGVG